jgi:diadenylate cyclase
MPEDLRLLLERLQPTDAVDIGLVALVFFLLLSLLRGTRAVQLVRGLIILILLGSLLTSTFLRLEAVSWLLRNTLPVLLFSIPVIFQPELRRALERLGSFFPTTGRWWGEQESVIEPVVQACQRLSERRHGGLIVLERDTGLQEYIDTGVPIEAKVTPELLLTIFYVGTSLHDGAAIIRGTRLMAAACILPLSSSGTLTDRRMGLRHRAGLGISELSDAVAVIVSEETGQISVAHNGRMIRRLDAQRLSTILHAFQQPRRPSRAWLGWLRRRSGIGGRGPGVGVLMGEASRSESGAGMVGSEPERTDAKGAKEGSAKAESTASQPKEATLQSTASGGGGD